MGRLVVIKVGGSLLRWKEFPARLRGYLDGLRSERILLVIGGGPAADFIRELDSVHGIGEKRSHGLALRALDLTARVVADLVPGLSVVERTGDLPQAWENQLIPVLAPRWFLENIDSRSPQPLAESWAVSTDSIAARAAVHLGASELRLVKSANPGGPLTRSEAARIGLVDPTFPAVTEPLSRLFLVNLRATPPTSHEMD